MYGLATIGQAPKIFARTNKYGTPIYAIGLSVALGFLAYMGGAFIPLFNLSGHILPII